MKQIQRYISSGYTHLITYEEFHRTLRMFVEKTFPTTADAVSLHIGQISEASNKLPGTIRNLSVKELKELV